MESDKNLGFEQVSDLSGIKRICERISENSDSVIKKIRVSENLNDDHGEEPILQSEIDLNISNDADDVGECNQIGQNLNSPIREVINISSNDDDDDKKLGNSRNNKQKGVECSQGLDLQLGTGGQRRYTREEKGKSKVNVDFLSSSLPNETQQVDSNLNFELDNGDSYCDMVLTAIEELESLSTVTYINVFMYRYENGMIFDKKLNFSDKLKAIIDQNTKHNAEKLIDWSPHRFDFDFRPPRVPSLMDLSLDILAKNTNAISTFEHVPEWLKQKLTNFLCDTNRMDIHILELLFKDSPSQIRIKDCSWMTKTQLVDVLAESDLKNLRVLQLDYCDQCPFDDVINSLAQSPNSLVCLGILSLNGAGSLCDNNLKPLLVSAPFLQSINFSQCTLLTHFGIILMAHLLKTNLKELYIDYCPRIDAMLTLTSIMKFEHLEVLSVAGIDTVCDEFVAFVTSVCGKSLKELNLADCVLLTDKCLQAIGHFCTVLCSLNVSYLCNLTDLGMCYLADGCRSLESLDVTHANFSDAVVAAYLETSGWSLKQLSLNHVRKVSFNTAYSLAKYSRNLVSLDVSGCRELTNAALGFITDNCTSLKLLKIFGCTQITKKIVFGHANSRVHILGPDLLPLLQHVDMLPPEEEVLLHYSPFETPLLPNNGM